jgi:hypothetical protein
MISEIPHRRVSASIRSGGPPRGSLERSKKAKQLHREVVVAEGEERPD